VTALNDNGLRPSSLTLSAPTLDDVFLQVTGQRYEEDAGKGPVAETFTRRGKSSDKKAS